MGEDEENLVDYCPMCGGKDISYFHSLDILHDDKPYFDVGCNECDAKTLIYYLGQYEERTEPD